MQPNQCNFIKLDGIQCQANHINNSDYCFRHDPTTSEVRLLASQKGGQNRALQGVWGQDIQLTSPKDLKLFLGQVMNGVWTGQVPVSVGTSMGFLSRCWLDAYDKSELEDRIKNIENKLGV